jgi:hypothetical protein
LFVYLINKNNTPLIPVTPRIARKMVENEDVTIHSKTPFIIQSKVDINLKDNNYIFFNVNFLANEIEFTVVAKNNGDLYYYNIINFDNKNVIEEIEGVFYFVKKYIYITHIYFMINCDALFLYEILKDKEIEFNDNSFNNFKILNNYKSCLICKSSIENNEFKIYKIIMNYSFSGNGFIICKKCLQENKYRDNGYIKGIHNLYNILLDTKKIALEFFKNENKD